jgi:hypothetical protein
MKYPFRAAASVFTTGVVSWLLSNLLPWFWGFTWGHYYGFPLQPDLGVLVPTVAVILAAFLFTYGLFVRGVDKGTTMVFLNSEFDDEPEDRLPYLDATVDGPDLDGL